MTHRFDEFNTADMVGTRALRVVRLTALGKNENNILSLLLGWPSKFIATLRNGNTAAQLGIYVEGEGVGAGANAGCLNAR